MTHESVFAYFHSSKKGCMFLMGCVLLLGHIQYLYFIIKHDFNMIRYFIIHGKYIDMASLSVGSLCEYILKMP